MPNWFTALTGLTSDAAATVRDGIVVEGDTLVMRANGRRLVAGRLDMVSLSDLPPPLQGPRWIRLREVVADVQSLHADPANAGAVFQVASQFNLLEMVSPDVRPEAGIARYATDRTQGPACAMACAAGTIWRAYLMPVQGGPGQSATRQVNALAGLGQALGNDEGRMWRMRNGYALPLPGGLAKVAASIAVADREELKALLQVGVQSGTQVTLGSCRHMVTQVYASALPVAYGTDPVAAWEPFARLVLEAAYQATLAAALRAGAGRVFLTRLGGGAFGNPANWITDTIALALHRHAAADLEVILVSYGAPDPANRPLLAQA